MKSISFVSVNPLPLRERENQLRKLKVEAATRKSFSTSSSAFISAGAREPSGTQDQMAPLSPSLWKSDAPSEPVEKPMGGLTFEPFGGEAHLANRAALNTHSEDETKSCFKPGFLIVQKMKEGEKFSGQEPSSYFSI